MIKRITDYIIFTILVILHSAACTPKEAIQFVEAPTVITGHPTAPLTCYIDFKTSERFTGVIFTLTDSSGFANTLRYADSERSEKGYLIYLLKPGRTTEITMKLEYNDGSTKEHLGKLHVTTPKLPSNALEFPGIEVDVFSQEKSEPGYTIFNPRRRLPDTVPNANQLNKSFGMLMMADHLGEVVWYYQINSRISDFDILGEGMISYMTQDNKIIEMDFGGNIHRQWYAKRRPDGPDPQAIPVDALTFHHDAARLSSGNWLVLSSEVREIENYYTSEMDATAPRTTQKVMGDVVIEFNEEGEIVHRWNSFDHLPVERIGYETFSNYWGRRGFPEVIDWSHANAIVPVDNDQAYLINFRYQSALVNVHKATGEIQWIFAEPSGWDDDLQSRILKTREEDQCWHQHAPSFTSEGNLLLFNNNNFLARPFKEAIPKVYSKSHVAEYKLDEINLTAEKMWSSQLPGEGYIASVAMGSAFQLPETGNILAGYGLIVSPKPSGNARGVWTMVREFSHTAPAELVWELRLVPKKQDANVGWTLFGAKRISL